MKLNLLRFAAGLLALAATACLAESSPTNKPTLFLIGDSTVKNSTKGQVGWGTPIAKWFDASKASVQNRALGGRSSRTFLTEGLWDKVLADIKPGDVVLMQFGHNDGGGLKDPKGRASIKGTGDETAEAPDAKTGQPVTVHSYGWYLRRYIADAKVKGAVPVVLSPIPRNIWKDGKVARAANDYGKWAAESAKSSGVPFIDLNELVARRYEELGEAKVKAEFFGATDHTHTTPAGAEVNAEIVATAVAELKQLPVAAHVLKEPAK